MSLESWTHWLQIERASHGCYPVLYRRHPFCFDLVPFTDRIMKVLRRNPSRALRPFTLTMQLHTFPFVFVTVAHKITLLAGCPVKRVHIIPMRKRRLFCVEDRVGRSTLRRSEMDVPVHRSRFTAVPRDGARWRRWRRRWRGRCRLWPWRAGPWPDGRPVRERKARA